MEKEAGAAREKMLDSTTRWLQLDKPAQMISCTWNHVRWRSMVANAMEHGTE